MLINQTPQIQFKPKAFESCSWWSRERVELGLKHGLAVLVVISSSGTLRTSGPGLLTKELDSKFTRIGHYGAW